MITVNELFAGIGAFRKALINLKIPHKIIGISEIDKFAIKSYTALYGETRNYGDILQVEKLDYADLWIYGFPCQDISSAGKMQGIIEKETRSGLLYEVKRLLNTSKQSNELPKFLIMENVKNLVSKRFKTDFDKYLEFLEDLGYENHWQVLNAKDYGVAQNRERVFLISIRKDLNQNFEFPKKKELKKRLKDYLENDVDDKFYLSKSKIASMLRTKYSQASFYSRVQSDNGIAKTLCARDYKDPTCILLGKIQNIRYEMRSKVYSTDGLSPTLNTCSGGGTQVKIGASHRVRALTPKEYWRLMGFSDSDFDKAQGVCSNSQLYKQAGNSIVVSVAEEILKNLIERDSYENIYI